MAYEQLCMYCFEDLQGQTVCPHCGRDSSMAVPQIQMLPGTLVYRNRFLVGRALGQDATGIVYAAYDTKRENKLRLREYLPRDCAERLNDGSVVPMAGLEDQFEKGMRKLRASVEGVDDPRKRHFYFEENGTAYIAQRKSGGAAAAAARDDEDDDRRAGARQMAFIIGGAVVFVVIAAVVIVSLLGGALRNADDVVQNPTLGPTSSNSLWAPEITASPTPYATPTFSALVDPEQSWMDYTYAGDVNKDFDHQQSQVSKPTKKPTAVPTLKPEATKFDNTIDKDSSVAEITALQQRLAVLGWLPANGITGSYDGATRQAVMDFQNYVNTVINPSQKLSVDGIAGPKTQQWLYSVDAVKPTAQPTPVVTPDPDDGTVYKNSPKVDIVAVQRKLIVLGLMKQGSDDGVYGSTTTAAVKKFQQRVNQLQGYNALEISGVVDPTTMAYLNYYVEWWQELNKNTPSPAPVLPTTPAPTDAPTPEPTDIPDKPEDNENRVDQDSPKESIAFVQEMLIAVGLLPEGSNDGVYGSSTANAVVAFQQWVNSVRGEDTLAVTGIADQNTLDYLEYAYGNGMSAVPTQKPTDAPTDAPTSDPTDAPEQGNHVDKDSPKESIAFMQNMLIAVGLLPEGSDDGVYGNGTTNAVMQFQQWVNSVQGEGTLAVTGVADHNTLNYLEYAFENDMVYNPGGETQPENTPDVPQETPDPDQGEDNFYVDADSPKESIQYVQSMMIEAGLLKPGSDDGVYGKGTEAAMLKFQQYMNANYLGAGTLPETGVGDSLTLSYLEEFISRGLIMPADPTDEPEQEPTKAPSGPVEIDLEIGGTEMIGGVHALTGDRVTFNWKASVPCEYYIYVTDAEGNSVYSDEASDRTQGIFGAEALTPGMVYTIQVGALPLDGSAEDLTWIEAKFGVHASSVTPEPTDEPTPEPEKPGVIESLSLNINGAPASGVTAIVGGVAAFDWSATGDVDYYIVTVKDSNDKTLVGWDNTQKTQGSFDASTLTPGEIYTIRVGAVPTNDGEVVWTEARFGVPMPETTDAPVTAPKIEVKTETYVEEKLLHLVGPEAVFTWKSEGAVAEYRLYMVNSQGVRKEIEPTADPEFRFMTAALPADTYMLYVGAVPVGMEEDENAILWNRIVFVIDSVATE